MRSLPGVMGLAALLWACETKSPDAGVDPVVQSAAASAKPAPFAPPFAPSAAAIAALVPSVFHGSYASFAGTLHLPTQLKGVRWTVADVDAGFGDGTLSLSIDPSTRRVRGTVNGPLGPATIDGYAADGNVTAMVVRSDPSDRGFTGTLEGEFTDGGADGTMNVSLAEASAVRRATFKLSPGGDAVPAR